MARILVAEDEVPVREFIRRALEHRGHEVVAVADGADALVKLNRGPFDLLLTDIGMPNMDGVELALKVARDWPDLPVLMMSGYALERRRAHGIDGLAEAVLQKPFSMVDLNVAVEQVLASRAPAG
ncbi:response regulator [Ferrovibrio xuzhouensis]|uniref:Response regulator n=1 Tax=Ferrovibrio xuzhouensis TaxID=1576914 RepID=A0ABV7VD73_9PROT